MGYSRSRALPARLKLFAVAIVLLVACDVAAASSVSYHARDHEAAEHGPPLGPAWADAVGPRGGGVGIKTLAHLLDALEQRRGTWNELPGIDRQARTFPGLPWLDWIGRDVPAAWIAALDILGERWLADYVDRDWALQIPDQRTGGPLPADETIGSGPGSAVVAAPAPAAMLLFGSALVTMLFGGVRRSICRKA